MSVAAIARLVQTTTRREGRLFVLSGPSGGGKTTLVRHLLAHIPGIVRSVSVTTRARRRGERAGRAYHFVTPRAFQAARVRGAYLEWASVHGAFYATPRRLVERALTRGQDVLLAIDVHGAAQVKQRKPACVRIFLLPPSWRTLMDRLRQRGTEDSMTRARRLQVARQELRLARQYDYVVVNDQLARAVQELAAIITAERLRLPQR